jgi:C4-dicarboxylate-specific signal transduction histidine kinase
VTRTPFRQSRMLIIDDDRSNVLLVERVLTEAGYTNLRSTTDPRRAVPHCAEFRPDRVRSLLEPRSLHAELRRRNQDLEAQVRECTQQLIEADQLTIMGNLLAGVAHELNNPLSVVSGHVAMFLESAPEGPLRVRAEKIAAASDRCVRIVKSFLAMARRRPPERGSVAVNQIIQDVVELLAYELRVSDVDPARTWPTTCRWCGATRTSCTR